MVYLFEYAPELSTFKTQFYVLSTGNDVAVLVAGKVVDWTRPTSKLACRFGILLIAKIGWHKATNTSAFFKGLVLAGALRNITGFIR
jgi:hypothetical protein